MYTSKSGPWRKYLCLFVIYLSLLNFSRSCFGYRHIQESSRKIPIAYDADIVVIGGTTAGVAAAIEASGQGKDVFLISNRPYVGEDICGTYRLWIDVDESPSTNLAELLFGTNNIPEGYVFTYYSDIPSSYPHEDTNPPSVLNDGLWKFANSQSVQYNDDVNIIIDLGQTEPISLVHAFIFQKNDDFEVETLSISASNDPNHWLTTTTVNNGKLGVLFKHPEWGPISLTAALNTNARYIKFNFRKSPNANRILLGEIIVENPALSPASSLPTPMHIKRTLANGLRNAGVKYMTGCYLTDILMDENNKPAGVVTANRSGRQAITSKIIIDTTTHAVAAHLAGADFSAFEPGQHMFKRIVLGEHVASAQDMEAEILPYTIEDCNIIQYTMMFDLPDNSYQSYARVEQIARDKTWSSQLPPQQDAAELLFYVPKDKITAKLSMTEGWSEVENLNLDIFQSSNVEHLYVLGPCADLPRPMAQYMLRYCDYIRLGERIGYAAACQADTIPTPLNIQCNGNSIQPNVSGDIYEFLNGIRPMQECMSTVQSLPGSIPVISDYNIVVIGGGTSGAPAGIGAARNNPNTLEVEYLYGLGGVGTLGYIAQYSGTYFTGFTSEIDDGVTAMGGRKPEGTRVYWLPEIKMEWYRKELREAGADIWFGCMGYGAIVENNTVKGVVVATPMGKKAILANVVIDSTGNADIAAAAGAQANYINQGVFAMQGTGLPPKNLGQIHRNSDWTFTDLCDTIDIWRTYYIGRERWKNNYDIGQLVDTRERRRIIGDFVLSPMDVYNQRTYPDTIVKACARLDSHGYLIHPYFMLADPPGYNWYCYYPYRCLLPRKIEAILVTGLAMSAHRDAMPFVRMQAHLQNQGYAAGVAAAKAVQEQISPRYIDVNDLQQHLVDKGNLPSEILTHQDSYPLLESVIQQAVANIDESFTGLEKILVEPDTALPYLRQAYSDTETNNPIKIIYAQILGILGDNTGLDALLSEIVCQDWDVGWDFQVGSSEERLSKLDSIIIAAGTTTDQNAIPALLEKVESLDHNKEFSHHFAITLALDNLKSPLAAEPLANLLQKPEMSGYAITRINDFDFGPICSSTENPRRGNSIRELLLAQALYDCGDYQGLGESILRQFETDIRGHFATYAHNILKKGCPDINNDCQVNFKDYIALASEWLKESPLDLDRDGQITIEDLMFLVNNWRENISWPSANLPD